MQFSINKAKATAIIVTILMITSIAMTALLVQAQEVEGGETAHGGQAVAGFEGPTTVPTGQIADFTINPKAFLSVSPNPVGIGQELLINVWITFPSGEGKYMVGYKVTITKPDGSTEDINLKSYVADGTSWFTYIPDQIGDWKFQFFFAGEWFPAGYYESGQYSVTPTGTFSNAIFNPSDYVAPAQSDVRTVTVQSEIVASWQSPLPTDLWTRPIQPNNREWNAIAGNYPWGRAITADKDGQNSWDDEYYGPFVTAPNTPHIVWKRQGAVAGIIGGETGNYATLSNPGTPSVIYMGRAYQTVTKVMPTLLNGTYRQLPVQVAECYDLRTGQIYYDIPIADGGITPTRIAYWPPTPGGAESAVPGAVASGSWTGELHTISGGRLYKINPLTGAITLNVTLATPAFTQAEMFYRDGYYLSYRQTNTTTITNANITVNRATTGHLVNWSTQGTSTNFTTRIASNVTATIPNSLRTLYQTGGYGALGAYDPETGITVVQDRFIYGGYYGSNYWAVNLKTGQMLWNISTPVSLMESAYRPTNAWNRHGRYIAEMERGYWQARDINTGAILWETDIPDLPWGEFWMYDEAAYENLLLGVGYTGVWALDEVTGDIVWHYNDPAVPFETPYNTASGTMSSYSVQTIRIADGKVYVANDEHSATQPATRGWGLICLNVTTGEKLWKISGTRMSPGAAADGYLTTASSYDGFMYVLGKGPSKTTVTAPLTTVAKDSKVLIQGTVLDMSPAQPGTPCISDDAMDTWMDYTHLQMPSDGYYHNVTVTGVPVVVYAIDSNGNTINIGTTTSDTSGSYQIGWTPTVEGIYKVTATFAGSDSYGSSWAETGLSVGPAPTVTTPPASPTPVDYTWTIVGMGVVIIIVVAIGVALILMKKH